METVKYYKDLGLEFVDGDVASDCKMNQVGANSVNHNDNFDDETVKEFAWRTNTGEKPSYDGDIEVKGYSTVNHVNQVRWSTAGKDIEWRPVIAKEDKMEGKTNDPRANERVDIPECKVSVDNRTDCNIRIERKDDTILVIATDSSVYASDSEEKPTYTKEMHDAGKLPPIGSEVEICNIEDADWRFPEIKEGDKLTCIAHTLDNDTTHNLGVYQKRGMAISIRPAYIRPIDTRTDEQKLADLIIDIVEDYQHGEYIKRDIAESVSEELIKAGYRKP